MAVRLPMLMPSRLLLLLALFLFVFSLPPIVAAAKENVDQSTGHVPNSLSSTDRRLSVLVASPPLAGHSNRMMALGEELVRRGHNVSFCSTLNWENLDKKALERGMQFLNAGVFPLDGYQYRALYKNLSRFLSSRNYIAAVQIVQRVLKLNIEQVLEFLKSENLQQWDVILVDFILGNTVTCLAKQANVPVVNVIDKIVHPDLQPEWPFPFELSTMTDDLTFTGRLTSYVQQLVFRGFIAFLNPLKSNTIDHVCSVVFHTTNPHCQEFPCLVMFPMGLEFARTRTPLVEYVGPLLSKQIKQPLPAKLPGWLSSKPKSSVVYISMGSLVEQTVALAQALVEGLQSTRYSVIWSLKKSNQFILDGLYMEPSRFLISDWVPQEQLLQHPAIAMAIVHGGTGGVTEALYNGVSLIVIPVGGDQWANAARVKASGAGIALDMNQLTAVTIRNSVEAIESGEYRKKAQKLRKIFLQAGGVDRAADLVELYADVGYQHLVPAYVKYKWSWVQYYNVDVQLVLCVLVAGVIYCTAKLCKCCCHHCHWCTRGSRKNKTE